MLADLSVAYLSPCRCLEASVLRELSCALLNGRDVRKGKRQKATLRPPSNPKAFPGCGPLHCLLKGCANRRGMQASSGHSFSSFGWLMCSAPTVQLESALRMARALWIRANHAHSLCAEFLLVTMPQGQSFQQPCSTWAARLC